MTRTKSRPPAMRREKQDIWLACHAQAAAAVKLGLRHGFRVLYHCSYADDEALDMLEAKKSTRSSSRRRSALRMARSMPIRRSTCPKR